MSSINFEKTHQAARILLNRPPLNTLNIKMLAEIGDAIESLHSQDQVKLIILGSTSKVFSAGVDMADHTPQKVFELLDALHRIFLTLVDISKPTLAVVQGPALGAGCELAAFCDVVVASEEAKFGQPELKAGVFPSIAPFLLPALVGRKSAMEFILSGESVSAQEALSMGLVSRVVPSQKVEEVVNGLASRISCNSGPVLQLMKRAMSAGEGKGFQQALKKTQDIYLNQLMNLEDAEEGLSAFREKRAPVWKNR